MIRSLWIAKTGLDAQQTNLDAISNNLANANTAGFKSVRPMFEDLLYQTIRAPGANTESQNVLATGLQIGAGSRVAATERLNTQGGLVSTGNSLDVAIQGNGFFQIQTPDGSFAYTRDGNFTKNSSGQIVTISGDLLAPGITLPSDTTSVTITADGRVQYTQQDITRVVTAGSINLVNFINPSGLASIGRNLFLETPTSGTPQQNIPGTNGLGVLVQGNIEQSNVNVAEELVNMIAAQRAYEINARAITASDQMLQKIGQL
jgi:flagellar basal-body rod protein FlgG